MSPPFDIQPEQGRVVATAALNIRSGRPDTRAPVVRTVPSGTRLDYRGRTDSGESINGNPRWYQDAGGNFFWSGGVRAALATGLSDAAGAASLPLVAGSSIPQTATAAMLDLLDDFLPPPAPPLPAPGVSVVGLEEKAVGIGNRRGIEVRNAFGVAELKGIRLDARVRFQLWAAGITEAGTAITDLNDRLNAGRDRLWASGLLRFELESVSPADSTAVPSAWRQSADYRILYEYRYQDSDGAQSLIARIPIAGDLEVRDSPERETTVVTDDMVRWDDTAAPALSARGPRGIAGMASLAFVTGTPPSGAVALTRTFDGASGPPAAHADLASFLAAVAGSSTPQRHAQVGFASLGDFLDAFSALGVPVPLGDWDLDGTPDAYQAGELPLSPAIPLPGTGDRFEIAFENAAFDKAAVVYLRVIRG
jgi:hypothetical protein